MNTEKNGSVFGARARGYWVGRRFDVRSLYGSGDFKLVVESKKSAYVQNDSVKFLFGGDSLVKVLVGDKLIVAFDVNGAEVYADGTIVNTISTRREIDPPMRHVVFNVTYNMRDGCRFFFDVSIKAIVDSVIVSVSCVRRGCRSGDKRGQQNG